MLSLLSACALWVPITQAIEGAPSPAAGEREIPGPPAAAGFFLEDLGDAASQPALSAPAGVHPTHGFQ